MAAPQADQALRAGAERVLRGQGISDPRAGRLCHGGDREGHADHRVHRRVGRQGRERAAGPKAAEAGGEERRGRGLHFHAEQALGHRWQRAVEQCAVDQPLVRPELRGMDRGEENLHLRAARHRAGRGAWVRLRVRPRVLRGSPVPLRERASVSATLWGGSSGRSCAGGWRRSRRSVGRGPSPLAAFRSSLRGHGCRAEC
jgi:hypothetical protein